MSYDFIPFGRMILDWQGYCAWTSRIFLETKNKRNVVDIFIKLKRRNEWCKWKICFN